MCDHPGCCPKAVPEMIPDEGPDEGPQPISVLNDIGDSGGNIKKRGFFVLKSSLN